PSLTHTYSIALSILFLDRLDDPADVSLIESLVVRLLAGQAPGGSWSYNCPAVPAEEVRRLTDLGATLKGRRDLPKLPPKSKRTPRDVSKEGQALLVVMGRGPGSGVSAGDNSNTQFATLAVWVGRRYGLPVQAALLKIDGHFRATQRPDGGWAY